MSFSLKDQIPGRKSVRTYDGRPLTAEDYDSLAQYTGGLSSPFGVPVAFRLLDAGEYDLSSPVIAGTGLYLAAKVEKTGHYELSFGYCFEKACLYAASLGIGTVMLAASLSRSAFEKAMEVGENEVLPVASPVGYPAAKRSIRKSLMRKAIKADERLPFRSLFFAGAFDRPLSPEEAGDFREALEMVRLAPSAANRQPWRAVTDGNMAHFYEKRSIKENALGDIQKVDMGIALCHFDVTAEETGMSGRFVFRDPGIAAPSDTEYIVSFERS